MDTETTDLKNRLERRERELKIISDLSCRLMECFELHPLLQEVMDCAKSALNCEASSIVLLSPDTDKLFFYATDAAGANLKEITLERGQGIVGKVVETGQHVIVNDVTVDSRFYEGVDQESGFVTRSILCVPLKVEGQALGALEVLNKQTGNFTENDRELCSLMGSQAAMAIQYVQMTEKQSMNERLALVGNMAATIIHDLRNSMQLISGFSQLIALSHPEAKSDTEVVSSEVSKVVNMCQELLDFSKGSALTLEKKRIFLKQFLEELATANLRTLSEQDILFTLEDVPEDIVVELDTAKMQRVLQNIINNAADALTDQKTINLTGAFEHGQVTISITDTGKGMDEATLSKIFKPFFTKGKAKGTGLGMAIVKDIVEAHSGSIDVQSTPARGTTFRIHLPAVNL